MPDDLIDHGRLTALAMRLLKSGMGAAPPSISWYGGRGRR